MESAEWVTRVPVDEEPGSNDHPFTITPKQSEPERKAQEDSVRWRTLADIDDAPPGDLICDMVEPDGGTLIYAAGGTGKGMTGAYLIAQFLKLGVKSLIYDAEGHPREWRRRTAGLGVDPGDVVYVGRGDLPHKLLAQPLHRVVPNLGKVANAAGAGLLIVDSILAAANLSEEGLKSDAAAPYLYTGALGELGIPSVSFGHTPKANPQGDPYGAVSWVNAMRLTWHGTIAEGDTGHRVRWTPRKRNERGDIRSLLFTFSYDDKGRPCKVDVEDAERHARELITTVLMRGPANVDDIAAEILALDTGDRDGSYGDHMTRTKDLVRRTLNRMKRERKVHKSGGRGGPWALGTPR